MSLESERKVLYAAQSKLAEKMCRMDLKLDRDYKSGGGKMTDVVKTDKAILSALADQMGQINDRIWELTKKIGDAEDE